MSFPLPLRKSLLVGAVLLVLLPAGSVAVGERLCRQPIDVGSTLRVPAWVERAVKRDEVAYPFHATLGATLSRFSCQPVAIGLQWFKAAAHARSAADLEAAAAGLSGLSERDESGTDLAADLCRGLAGSREGERQAAVLAKAGVQCPGPTPTAR